MSVVESHERILEAMDRRLVREAIDATAIVGRLDQCVSDAIERAPGFATWASGRLALLRLEDRDRRATLGPSAVRELVSVP